MIRVINPIQNSGNLQMMAIPAGGWRLWYGCWPYETTGFAPSDLPFCIDAMTSQFLSGLFRAAGGATAYDNQFSSNQKGKPDKTHGPPVKQGTNTVSPSITPAGALVKQPNLNGLTASVTPSAALVKLCAKILSASLTAAGTLVKSSRFASFSGSLTPSGSLTKTPTHTFSGSSTPSGTVVKMPELNPSGSITPSGSLLKQIAKTLTADITTAMSDFVALYIKGGITIEGSITPTGALAFLVFKVLSGSSTASGSLTKMPETTLPAASSQPSGSFRKSPGLGIVAGASTVGSLTKQPEISFSGSSTPTAVLSSASFRSLVLSASVTAAGALTKAAARIIGSPSITTSGSLTKRPATSMTGSATPSGSLVKMPEKVLSGSSTTTGDLTVNKIISLILSASMTATSTLSKVVEMVLSGNVTPTAILRRHRIFHKGKAIVSDIAAVGMAMFDRLKSSPASGERTPGARPTDTSTGTTPGESSPKIETSDE